MAKLLPFVLLAVAFWFLVLRPTQRHRANAAAMAAQLAPGVDVITAGGMHGTVISVDDTDVVLAVAPGVEVRFLKGAIRSVVDPEQAEPEHDRITGDPPELDSADPPRGFPSDPSDPSEPTT
jgi:preprotein translocase subunit YajC